jgi:hypothetical protein
MGLGTPDFKRLKKTLPYILDDRTIFMTQTTSSFLQLPHDETQNTKKLFKIDQSPHA